MLHTVEIVQLFHSGKGSLLAYIGGVAYVQYKAFSHITSRDIRWLNRFKYLRYDYILVDNSCDIIVKLRVLILQNAKAGVGCAI